MAKKKESLVAGSGPIFDRFLESRQITGYTGKDSPFASFFDDDYDEAPLKIICFDQSFKHLPYDARTVSVYWRKDYLM